MCIKYIKCIFFIYFVFLFSNINFKQNSFIILFLFKKINNNNEIQIEVKPQIHNIKQQNPYHNQMQQHHQMQQQHHAHHQYNTGNWNQNYQSQPIGQLGNNAPNSGSWTGQPGYANQMASANNPQMNQQWGFLLNFFIYENNFVLQFDYLNSIRLSGFTTSSLCKHCIW